MAKPAGHLGHPGGFAQRDSMVQTPNGLKRVRADTSTMHERQCLWWVDGDYRLLLALRIRDSHTCSGDRVKKDRIVGNEGCTPILESMRRSKHTQCAHA